MRNEMVAKMAAPKQPEVEKKKKVIQKSKPFDEFERMLKDRIAIENNRKEFVSAFLPKLVIYGNVIFKVEHIPGDLTICDLNSLLGTGDIQQNQVIGVRYPYKRNKSVMNARVILKSDSLDVKKITKYHGRLAPGINEKLNIRQTDIKELEGFLLKNYPNLVKLDQKVLAIQSNLTPSHQTSNSSQNQGQRNSPLVKTKQPPTNERVLATMDVQNGSEVVAQEQSPPRLVIDETKSPTPPPVAMNANVVDCFVPLTIDTLPYAINILYKLSVENRLVFVTFDQCFTDPNLNLDDINKKYSSLCGKIEDDCVVIKTNLDKLMPDIKTAYGKEFRRLPRAFIITPKKTDKQDLVSKSDQNMVLCGLMTFSCIVMNLKKSTFLMSRNALLRAGAPEASVTPSQIESPLNKGKRPKLSVETTICEDVDMVELPIFI